MIGILLDILVNVVIFYIIYSAMNKDVDYFKNVLIYAIGMEIELFIVMLISGYISILMLLMVFGAYFILGLIVVFIVDKLNKRYLFEKIPFIIIAVVINIVVTRIAIMLFRRATFNRSIIIK